MRGPHALARASPPLATLPSKVRAEAVTDEDEPAGGAAELARIDEHGTVDPATAVVAATSQLAGKYRMAIRNTCFRVFTDDFEGRGCLAPKPIDTILEVRARDQRS